MMQNWINKAIAAYKKSQNPPQSSQLPMTTATTSDDMPKKENGKIATTTLLTPELTLHYMRIATILCLAVFLVTMLQFMISLNSMRAAIHETVHLQKEQQQLVEKLLDKLKCVNN
jgi:hypothetical protein